MMRKAVYPGTFDPVTLGHLDVLERALHIFDELVVAVAENAPKKPLIDLEERIRLIEENIGHLKGVTVTGFDQLIVDFAREQGAVALIRGLRAVSDFEYEFQMAQMNRNLDAGIETIYLMPGERYFYTSSHLVKQVYHYTTRKSGLVAKNVHEALVNRLHPSTDS